MIGPNTFDWTTLDILLIGSANRKKHAAVSFYISWGNDGGSELPTFLQSTVSYVNLIHPDTAAFEGVTPNFGDNNLLVALEDFIAALGARYDGDQRIAAFHTGLLGFWGEWHVFPYDPNDLIVTNEAKQRVADAFVAAFTQTQVQARYPEAQTNGRFGFYDGSFAYATLDGEFNGGVEYGWYFMPRIVENGQQDAWRTFMIAGETFPQIQDIVFTDGYPAGTEFRQDFIESARQTHSSWVLHHNSFSRVYEGIELANALEAHAILGYNFVVDQVQLYYDSGIISMDVTLRQIGIAPFYYDLSLEANCFDLEEPLMASEIQAELIAEGDSATFTMQGLPPTTQCVQSIDLKLTSSMLYQGTSIKFAQGADGRVIVNAPLPPGVSPTPTVQVTPTTSPTFFPTFSPTFSPVDPYDVLYFIPADEDGSDLSYLDISPSIVFCSGPPPGTQYQIEPPYSANDIDCHRWTGDGVLTYIISGLTPLTEYPLRLGFAENFGGNCAVGSRVFSVKVNDISFVTGLDIFAEVGCWTAHLITREVAADAAGVLTIDLVPIINNPAVSFIEVGEEIPVDFSSGQPSSRPSFAPSQEASEQPSLAPTEDSSPQPSEQSSDKPSSRPSSSPSRVASEQPSSSPSLDPTLATSQLPTESDQTSSWPSFTPSHAASVQPSALLSFAPSEPIPSSSPSLAGPSWESLVTPSVTNDWQQVQLTAVFVSPVVVCSVKYNGGSDLVPAVVRLRNVASESFEVRLQNPGDESDITGGRPVHCVCVEEGVWKLPDGRVVEAAKYTSTTTSYRNNWSSLTRNTLGYAFTTPVVVGQVMSFNNPRWSTFVTTANRRQNPPTSTNFLTGKHTGEDTTGATREDETVGYIVLEGGVHSTFGNTEIEAHRGSDSIRGFVQATFQYNFLSSFASGAPEVTIVSQNGVDGTDGSWAVLTSTATSSAFGLALDEDQLRDTERSHTTEQVSYLAISQAGVFSLSAMS